MLTLPDTTPTPSIHHEPLTAEQTNRLWRTDEPPTDGQPAAQATFVTNHLEVIPPA